MSVENIFPRAAQLDETNTHLGVIARALTNGATGEITSHSMAQAIVRAGAAKFYFAPGDLYRVNKETGVYVTITATGVTAATVNEDAFIAKVESAATQGYEFVYDGAAWHLDGAEVELPEYGVTVTGTPVNGDIIVVHVQGSVVLFDVLDADDYDVPINPALTHTLPLLSRDVLSYGTIPYCPVQLLKAVAEDEFPSGMAAGKYTLGVDHGAYNNSTTQDGEISVVITQPIPVGGGLRHTILGAYREDGDYSRAKLLTGTWTTYDASGNVIESGLETLDGGGGTNLGTATAETKSYMTGAHLNATRRQGNGSNYLLSSYMRMWLVSDAAGAASDMPASWWRKITEFDLPIKSTLPGFLHGVDPTFLAVICPVRKRTLLHPWDRTGDAEYIDTAETIWQPSMTELGFGTNSGVYECGAAADGTIRRMEAYALYKGATNAERIKRQGTTARHYFLRSPSTSFCDFERIVYASGALHNLSARYSHGAVGGLCIG